MYVTIKKLKIVIALLFALSFLSVYLKNSPHDQTSLAEGGTNRKQAIFQVDSVSTKTAETPFTETVANMINLDQVVLESLKQKIIRPKYDVDCKRILNRDKDEINRTEVILRQLRAERKLQLIEDANFIIPSSMCALYKQLRLGERAFFNKPPPSGAQSPIAYSILLHNDVEQFERFLMLIYHPNNIYCVHVDFQASEDVKKAVKSIADCFDNVFVTTRLESVMWGGFSLLRAQMNCISDLVNLTNLIDKHANLMGKRLVEWKYFMNTVATEFPLRSYSELVQIINIYNGSNELEIVRNYPIEDRVKYRFIEDASQKSFMQTQELKSPPPHNFSITKGYTFALMNRRFVEYGVFDQRARDLLKWLEDTWIPDELFWTTLQFNTQFYPDNGFVYLNESKIDSIVRFTGWMGEYSCKGMWRHYICVLSVGDLEAVKNRKELIANKFMLDYDPIAFQCMEEWYLEREGRDLTFDESVFYCQWVKLHSSRANC